MNRKRIILAGLWVLVIFSISYYLIFLFESSSENVIVSFFERLLNSFVSFWEILTLFVLSLGTSLFLLMHRAGNAVEKSRNLWSLCASVSSLISLLLILAAIRLHVRILPLSLPFFMLTGVFIGTAFHLLTLQIKIVPLEIVKIVFLGVIVSFTVFFAGNFASYAHNSGDTWESMLLTSLIFATIAAIASIIINFNILLSQFARLPGRTYDGAFHHGTNRENRGETNSSG